MAPKVTGRLALAALAALACAGCATSNAMTPQEHALYSKRCAQQGHKPDTDAWRACIETEDLNAGIARQRTYDDNVLRRLDCVDPRLGCAPQAR